MQWRPAQDDTHIGGVLRSYDTCLQFFRVARVEGGHLPRERRVAARRLVPVVRAHVRVERSAARDPRRPAKVPHERPPELEVAEREGLRGGVRPADDAGGVIGVALGAVEA